MVCAPVIWRMTERNEVTSAGTARRASTRTDGMEAPYGSTTVNGGCGNSSRGKDGAFLLQSADLRARVPEAFQDFARVLSEDGGGARHRRRVLRELARRAERLS